ncbi:MAG: tyrosine recombinase XerC [Oscillospiraceae bacterium]|jgi:site-specific recombinase XerD|nr:tyrosine recombinase XerC [Oscillospiraceae bacterium]
MLNKDEIKALPALVQEFLRYQGVIKNRSQKTVESYALDLRLFLRFMAKEKGLVSDAVPFEEIDISGLDLPFFKSLQLQDAYAFMNYIRNERNNTPTSQARRTVSIRSFYKYLTINRRLLDDNPMSALETPKLNKTLPKHLTLEQSKTLLDCIDGKNRERDYCMITFFLNCGLRLSELVSLDYANIRSEGTVNIFGKGAKERMIYLNQACVHAFEEYMAFRRQHALMSEKALFLSSRGKRISNRTVQHIISAFLDKAGLGGLGFSVHKLRHTAATLMYQHGNVDVLVLKEILGHENLGTTEIYTHVHNEQLKKAVQSNPLSTIEPKKQKKKKDVMSTDEEDASEN